MTNKSINSRQNSTEVNIAVIVLPPLGRAIVRRPIFTAALGAQARTVGPPLPPHPRSLHLSVVLPPPLIRVTSSHLNQGTTS